MKNTQKNNYRRKYLKLYGDDEDDQYIKPSLSACFKS